MYALPSMKSNEEEKICYVPSLHRKHYCSLEGKHNVTRLNKISSRNYTHEYTTSLGEIFNIALEEYPSISINQAVMGGAPCIDGTRIPVYMILDAIMCYGSTEDVLKSYSELTLQQVKDAVGFVQLVVECPLSTKIKLLFDECVQGHLAKELMKCVPRNHSVENIQIGHILSKRPDSEVINYAKKYKRVLVTVETRLNEKYYSFTDHHGIIILTRGDRALLFCKLMRSGEKLRCINAVTHLSSRNSVRYEKNGNIVHINL